MERAVTSGYVIFTTHGLGTHKMMGSLEIDEDGFYFKAHSEQTDLDFNEYGSTITTPRFVLKEISEIPHCKLKMLKTEFWRGHQDCYIVQKNQLLISCACE